MRQVARCAPEGGAQPVAIRQRKTPDKCLALFEEATAGLEPAIGVLQTPALTNLATSPWLSVLYVMGEIFVKEEECAFFTG